MTDSTPERTSNSRLLVGTAWVFVGKIITTGLVFIVNVLLARLLSPEELGAYFLIVSFVTTIAMVGQLGLNRAVVRLVAEALAVERPARAWGIVRVVIGVGLLGSVAIAALMQLGAARWFATTVFNSSQMISVATAVSIWVGIFSLEGLLSETFRGLHKIRLATFFGGLCSALVSAALFATIWLVGREVNLNEVVLLSLTAGITSITLAGILIARDYRQEEEPERIRIAKVLKLAVPMFVTGITLFGVREVHMWILGAFRPDEDVALYGATSRLINFLTMPLLIVNAVLPPIVAELNAKKKIRELEQMLRSSATLASVPAVLGFFVVLIWGSTILEFVFGSYYGQARELFIVLAAVTVVNVASGSPGVLLMMSGYERVVMRCAILSGLLGLLASIVFINAIGVTGVGIGVGVSVILNNLGTCYYARLIMGINTRAGWLPLMTIYSWIRDQFTLDPDAGTK